MPWRTSWLTWLLTLTSQLRAQIHEWRPKPYSCPCNQSLSCIIYYPISFQQRIYVAYTCKVRSFIILAVIFLKKFRTPSIFFMLQFHDSFHLGFSTTFFHPLRKACQASEVLQYSFVVPLLSGNQVNINITFFWRKSNFCCQLHNLLCDNMKYQHISSLKNSTSIYLNICHFKLLIGMNFISQVFLQFFSRTQSLFILFTWALPFDLE